MIPRATYRIQFHEGFTFADAEALVPYLDDLGISHVYASPITTATRGSTHGYDVVDPTRINPELGGEAAFRSLAAALRSRDMGIIIDIVPNHMGVAGGENPWWQDVLENGPQSAFAPFFDVDWREKLVLPVLGEPLGATIAAGQLRLEHDAGFYLSAYGEHRFPLRREDREALGGGEAAAALRDHDPGNDGGKTRLRELIGRQHYRLASWRVANDELNWRRFFTISELAGLRIEDPHVFETVHALVFRLYGEGLIDGVRIDHVDGLSDPAHYCRTLRERLDGIARPADATSGPAYIVVEKILAPGEGLATDWGLDGTSGYDFMSEAAALLHAPAGAAPLARYWSTVSGRPAEFEPEELAARQQMLAWAFEGQLSRCVAAFASLAASEAETEGLTAGMLRRAIERLLWVFPVYRTYGTGSDAPPGDAAIRAEVRARVARFMPPGEAHIADLVLAWLAGEGPGDAELAWQAVRRFQQLSAPIAAKAVEDTAFYRYGRLLSGNDVGFDPSRFACSVAEFHAAMAGRATSFRHGMLATATHDHKRGEDVRARLAVLSELPALWEEAFVRWRDLAGATVDGVDPADLHMLLQTMLGAWPEDLAPTDGVGLRAFAERVVAWQEKALREAKLRSSWEAPDGTYEERCRSAALAILGPRRSPELLADIAAFVAHLSAPAHANSLAQVALRYTVPGVPDLYQGAELLDLSLVDPDNRRPVDYAARRAVLAGEGDRPGAAKLRLIKRLLDYRRREPLLFRDGDYRPVRVEGTRQEHVVAFTRSRGGARLLCVIAIRTADALAGTGLTAPDAEWWGETRLVPDAEEFAGDLRIAALLVSDTVHVELVRTAGST